MGKDDPSFVNVEGPTLEDCFWRAHRLAGRLLGTVPRVSFQTATPDRTTEDGSVIWWRATYQIEPMFPDLR